MRCFFWILVSAVCLGVLGCGADKPADSSASGGGENHAGLTTAAPEGSGEDAAEMSMPVPPPGALYTLLCASFTNDGHIMQANSIKNNLIKGTNLKGWYVIHSQKESDLYYGFYKTFDDKNQPEEMQRAQDDHQRLAGMTDEAGNRLFPEVMFVPITTSDPPAPKEWELSSCKGYWTLQIAVYKGSPLRKQYAVDAVRKARAQGIEAYFHHSEATSEVCIGSWPREAVVVQNATPPEHDPNKRELYLSRPLTKDPNQKYYDRDGNEMQVIYGPSYDPVDPTLKKAIDQYPYTLVNGDLYGREVTLKDHSKKFIADPSFLVVVSVALGGPSDTATNDAGMLNDPDAGPAPDSGSSPSNSNDPSMGNLKSLGE